MYLNLISNSCLKNYNATLCTLFAPKIPVAGHEIKNFIPKLWVLGGDELSVCGAEFDERPSTWSVTATTWQLRL